MAFEPRNNSGSLWRNDRKEKPTHPDHSGQVMVDGKEYWISAWVKESGGKKFFSLAFKPKGEKAAPVERGGSLSEDLNDEIPFAPEWR